jgi:serine phosphatase RsbU (regulator of sigma subunit)
MNPFMRFKNHVIGDALASTENVFEKVRIDVLFSFTLFFFVINLPYLFISAQLSLFHTILALLSSLGLATVILILWRTKNVKKATLFYVFVHCCLNITHFIINDGKLEGQGALFFLLIASFSFLMLNRTWGLIFTGFVIALFIVGMYNMASGYSLFTVPQKYHDPPIEGAMLYFGLIPLLLNIYLVAQFVKARNKAEMQISNQKFQLEKNNKELALKNEDIISSINYAQKIQYAVLPNEESIYRSIPLSFIIYKPRDIVSGDFFWFHESSESGVGSSENPVNKQNSELYIVAADCTGHGVPGAFMTVIGSNALTQTVIENKITKPSEILTELDNRVTHTLKQEKTHYGLVQDGMDLALLKINKAKKELIFTSAKRPAFFIRNGELKEIKGSKSSIGGLRNEEKIFEEISISYREDDMIYLFSDGYVDQFGGTNNKKFTTRRLRELLLGIYQLPVNEQKERIEKTFADWKGENEQTDDMLVIGIRF